MRAFGLCLGLGLFGRGSLLGGGGGGAPSMDFSTPENSMYAAVLSSFVG